MASPLEALKKRYTDSLPERLRELESLCLSAGDAQSLADAIRAAHTIAGSSATFGLKELGLRARALERVLKGIESGDNDRGEIPAALKAVIFPDEPAQETPPVCAKPETAAVSPSASPTQIKSVDSTNARTVYIAEDDTELLNSLSVQISQYGYEVRGFSALKALRDAVDEAPPSVIVIDMMFPEGIFGGAQTAVVIRAKHEIPIIFISAMDEFESRLKAVRAGADAYFLKPINVFSVVDKIDMLTQSEVRELYRVLIVDDEVELSEYHAAVLRQAAMTVEVINDPANVFKRIGDFAPDIILMDMYMPGCTGHELAQVIRQDNQYLSIPIVFLSAETDLKRQLNAMQTGGDDFLTKPIEPEHLVSAVTARAERMRNIRSTMDCDSLTGLLNHTKTKEQLDIALDRARRSGGEVSFAMIDIDKFKSVNDTYGHPVGDKVIVSISKLLKQRLRRTDVVGRYGGEEFAVVLGETKGADALRVIDDIRKSFGQIVHTAGQTQFSCTFSCGIASFPQFDDVLTLMAESDKALYAAKHGGRNAVVLSGGL